MFDKEEYRAKLWEQIENEVLANGHHGMDYSELLEMVLDSDVIDCWDLA